MIFRGLLVATLLAPMTFMATSAQAAAVSGEANIAGNVSVSSTNINFSPQFVNTAGALETGS